MDSEETVVAGRRTEPPTMVAEPKAKTERKKRQAALQCHPVGSDDHSFEYVERMLHELFGHPPEQGYKWPRRSIRRARSSCLTTTKEHAELKRDQIHAYGKDDNISNCKGSMHATIEPAG